MNPDQLLEHFHRIGDAPDAIPRLRRFILDLAARGKLVPQDRNDEPAAELLKRIAKEKARLVKAGEARKSEVDPVDPSDMPFLVPPNWAWTRLGSVGDWGSGSTPPRGNTDFYGGGISWLKSGELNDNPQLAGSEETLTELALAKGSFRLNEPGNVLIAMYGATIGKVAILAEKAVTNQAVCGCTPFAGVFNRFLFLFLLSQREQFHSASEGGAQPNISKVKIVWTPFPLPPLAEQQRIVAKLDELMALCDRLEAARDERETTRDRLSAVSLARLNAPDPDPAIFADHARFALNNLVPLTTRPDQIKRLRQTILNLAVRGKLVPQDHKDEPASELLKRIGTEKARMVKAGEIKKAEPISDLTGSRPELLAPSGWVITNLQSVCASITDGDHLPPPKAESGIPFLVIGNVRNQRIDFAGSRFVPSEYYEALDPIRCPRSGDLLYTLVGSYGIPVVVRDDRSFCVQRHIGILRPSKLIDVSFLARAMESQWVFDQASACATGIAQKTVPLSGLRKLIVRLPPLAEQSRIVAKVDELMGLCDRLEERLAAGNDTRRRLLDAILAGALAPVEMQEQAA